MKCNYKAGKLGLLMWSFMSFYITANFLKAQVYGKLFFFLSPRPFKVWGSILAGEGAIGVLHRSYKRIQIHSVLGYYVYAIDLARFCSTLQRKNVGAFLSIQYSV
ncbi:UNVERIFIED_CONTAM: hypothetical protein K2H54_068141 [Gekko kuhli]